LGSCPTAIVVPSPNRNPVITGFEIRSATAPSRGSPEHASTAAVTRASAADNRTNRSLSPWASGAMADADRAAVAVVAPTKSVRGVPSSA
jgi:hypothetical protein